MKTVKDNFSDWKNKNIVDQGS